MVSKKVAPRVQCIVEYVILPTEHFSYIKHLQRSSIFICIYYQNLYLYEASQNYTCEQKNAPR